MAAEINDAGGELSLTEKATQWARENPDMMQGIQGSISNLTSDSPQQHVMEGAAEALGAGVNSHQTSRDVAVG